MAGDRPVSDIRGHVAERGDQRAVAVDLVAGDADVVASRRSRSGSPGWGRSPARSGPWARSAARRRRRGVYVTISCGRRELVGSSRAAKLAPSADVWASAIPTAPLPVTSGVTSHSAIAPAAIAPLSSCGPEVRAGRFDQLMPCLGPRGRGAVGRGAVDRRVVGVLQPQLRAHDLARDPGELEAQIALDVRVGGPVGAQVARSGSSWSGSPPARARPPAA